MTSSNFQRTADFLSAAKKQPGSVDDLSTQIGCHLEEACEFIDELAVMGSAADHDSLAAASTRIKGVAHRIKARQTGVKIVNRVKALDALCDSEVTGNGVAYLAEMQKEKADLRVLASNDAKLINGVAILSPGGKIMKPAGWHPPYLGDLV